MAVEKWLDLTATGPSIEEAVAQAVDRARLTLQGLTTCEVVRIEGLLDGDEITYRVHVRISFVIKEQIHE